MAQNSNWLKSLWNDFEQQKVISEYTKVLITYVYRTFQISIEFDIDSIDSTIWQRVKSYHKYLIQYSFQFMQQAFQEDNLMGVNVHLDAFRWSTLLL